MTTTNTVESAYEPRPAALRRPRRRHRCGARGASRRCPISLHCWQGDDVGGFEEPDGKLGGGLAATGNYPGKARTPDELRARRREGALADSRDASLQPARVLRRVRRTAASSVTRSVPSTSPAGSTGRSRSGSGSTSIRPASRIRKPPTASRSRIPTRRSGRSGSSTRRPAAGSAPRWGRRWARRA